MPARRESFDHTCTEASSASEPRLGASPITASTNAGEPSSERSRSVPTSPRYDPSTEASTSAAATAGPRIPAPARAGPPCPACPERREPPSIARRDDHDLTPRRPGAAADHVLQLAARVGARCSTWKPRAGAIPRVRHEGRRRRRPARLLAGRLVGGDDQGQACRLRPVEEHVRRQSLGQRPRAGLEGEHGQYHRQERRYEGSPVRAPRSLPPNLQFRRGASALAFCSWTTRTRFRSS